MHDRDRHGAAAARPAFRLLMTVAAVALISSCSVVFTAGINGRVVDAEEFADAPETGGINGVRVYLYLRERPRRLDAERYETDGLLPDEDGGEDYYLEAVTDDIGGEAGAFSFPTIYWHDLLPTYGRTGDRRDVFLLLHHPDYGLVEHTVTIVNDTSNSIAPIEITSLYEEATLSGRVERAGSTDGAEGVTVSIHAANALSGSTLGYPTDPTEKVTTGPDGNFSVAVSLLRELVAEATAELDGPRALLTFESDVYLANTTDDNALAEDRDVDGDGSNDVYYQTPPLSTDETNELPAISVRQISFSETLEGRVGVDTGADGNVDAGTNGALVFIYVDLGSPPDPDDPPDYTTTTGNRLVDQNVETGWFTFADLAWDDPSYAGNQSSIDCYIDVDVDRDGTITVPGVDVNDLLVTIYSNTANTVEIVLP